MMAEDSLVKCRRSVDEMEDLEFVPRLSWLVVILGREWTYHRFAPDY